FLLRPGRLVERVELGALAPVNRAVSAWRQALTAGRADTNEFGKELRRLGWAPLEPKLGGGRAVLFAPDGALGQVPFAGLPGKQAGTYLLEEYALAVLPVPQLLPDLLAADQGKTPAASLLAVGDVDYGAAGARDADPLLRPLLAPRGLPRDWAALPGTRG